MGAWEVDVNYYQGDPFMAITYIFDHLPYGPIRRCICPSSALTRYRSPKAINDEGMKPWGDEGMEASGLKQWRVRGMEEWRNEAMEGWMDEGFKN